jgi:hypothetical protein
MMPATPEGAVLKACLELLKYRGIYAWRNNVGAHKTAGRFVRYGKVGSSDIMAVLPGGRAAYFEVKRPGGKPTEAQKAFLSEVNRLGAFACVVDDARRLDAILSLLAVDPKARAEELNT